MRKINMVHSIVVKVNSSAFILKRVPHLVMLYE